MKILVEFFRGVLRNRPLSASLLLLLIIVLIVFGRSCRDYLTNRGYEKREELREEKRSTLEEEFRSEAAEFGAAIERARRLEEENAQLRRETDRARAEADQARREINKLMRKYEESKSNLDSIRDYVELRRVNCKRRAELGYPCPD